MAITTDSTYVVTSGGINYDIIGYSKTLNNYTTDEIKAFHYCSSDNTLMKHIQKKEQIAYFTMVENTGVAVPWNMTRISSTNISINAGDKTKENYGQLGVYCGIIWLARTSNGNDMYITSSNQSNYKIVTSFKAKNYCYELSAPSIVSNSYGQSGWNGTQQTPAFPVWYLGGGTLYYYIDENGTNKINLNSQRIRPYAMFEHDSKVFFVQFSDNISITRYNALNTLNEGTDPNYYPWIASNGIGSFDGTGYAIAAAAIENYPVSSPFPKSYNKNSLGQYGSSFRHFAADDGICIMGQFGGTIHTPPLYDAGSETFIYFNSKDSVLDFWKGIGIKFLGDKVYKPIIVDGYVTGYTDDLTVESDLDNYVGDTNHTVPGSRPTPTPPTPSGDDYTDMDLGISNITLGGLTKYAILNKSELVALISDYNSNASMAGSNFSNHIICLYRLGFPASSIATTSTGNIVMVRSAGDVDFTSQANTYNLVTKQTVFIDAGGINVPRMTNTFYDFSPYTSYELYIPGCGWIPLPDNVAGRSIHVYIVFDLPTCSAKGIVRIAGGVYGGTTIATVNGVIGASCPFTIGENGQQRAAVMSANAQVASGIATGIVGGALANPYMAVAGGSNLLGGLFNAYTAGNTNYVSTKGGAADFSMFGDGGRAVLKINSPVIDSVVNNSDFGHTVGYMCNEIGQLNSFHGFTVCANPHIHISATSTEKEEIKRLLEEGVILP